MPNMRGSLRRLLGTDLNAERNYAVTQLVSCAVVHLNQKALKTSVRADSSASRGSADEFVSVSKILFPVNVALGIEDKFIIAGFTLKVTGIEPRFAVNGRHDHNEVTLEQWA